MHQEGGIFITCWDENMKNMVNMVLILGATILIFEILEFA